jgi:tetratricopeptide (TPR) repeat protein
MDVSLLKYHHIATRLSVVVRVSLSLSVFLAVAAGYAGEPYVPKDDDEVLETLPRDLLAGRDELDTLRRQLSQDPQNVELAARVAASYLQLGKSSGDPRFYGYAQAALGPWWGSATAPPTILKLRAKLKERDHRYDEALRDLNLLLKQDPKDAQAYVELANIYWVQGKYADAQRACDRLSEMADTVPTIMCRAPILAVTGKAEQAYASLTHILPVVRKQWPSVLPWVHTMQADIAVQLGRLEQAEQHFRNVLASDPADNYALRSYADLLLDQHRNEEVISLLREFTSDTGILLPAAIAAHRAGQQALAAEWRAQLHSRFEENRLRGNPPHGRYEALYQLELAGDPKRALALAQNNWRQQKQPADSRVLLEAAMAARDPAAAQEVLDFLAKNGTQHVALDRLAQQLERK